MDRNEPQRYLTESDWIDEVDESGFEVVDGPQIEATPTNSCATNGQARLVARPPSAHSTASVCFQFDQAPRRTALIQRPTRDDRALESNAPPIRQGKLPVPMTNMDLTRCRNSNAVHVGTSIACQGRPTNIA
jgi:hypothetical protein